MGLKEDLEEEVADILRTDWDKREGQKVPDPEDLALGNDGVNLDATVLYADMSDSTKLVDEYKKSFAAEVYKAYLTCAARVIKDRGGTITAYDGDRIMAVFIGDSKNSSAAESALRINYAVRKIINVAISKQYPNTSYELGHVVGIDTSKLLVARIGVRNDNDLVWVGRAANYAAKLSSIDDRNAIFITRDVYKTLNHDAKYSSSGELMWKVDEDEELNGVAVYRASWWRSI
jgi:class 3 adenylate cyclase